MHASIATPELTANTHTWNGRDHLRIVERPNVHIIFHSWCSSDYLLSRVIQHVNSTQVPNFDRFWKVEYTHRSYSKCNFRIRKKNICHFVLNIMLLKGLSSWVIHFWCFTKKFCCSHLVIASGMATISWQIKSFSLPVACNYISRQELSGILIRSDQKEIGLTTKPATGYHHVERWISIIKV